MKKLKPKVGQWCRVLWDDVGAQDGICVEILDSSEFRFFTPFDQMQRADFTQVVALGNMLEAKGAFGEGK